MKEKSYDSIWKEIKNYVNDDKNSLILLFGDKYFGKTEMLKYFIRKDSNNYKYLIQNEDIKDGESLIRNCFLKVLTTIYIQDQPQLLSVVEIITHKKFMISTSVNSLDFESQYKKIKNELQQCSIEMLQTIIDKILVQKIVINFYIGCYQFFDGFNDDIAYMNGLNTQISFNFIIATRSYSGKMSEYLAKFSNVRYFELITKKLEPRTYKIIGEKKYYKMPIYDKFLEERGIDYNLDTEDIKRVMNTNEYFKNLDDEIGYGYVDSENLLLMSLIMAAGCLERHQIEFVFKIIETQRNISMEEFMKQYEFIWELQGKIFCGSTWGEFVFYNRFNEELKKQLDSFFSTLLYGIFMEVPTSGVEVTTITLRELLNSKKDYSFFIDSNLSEAYQLLISLAVSYKKHRNEEKGFIANPANALAVDFLNKYVLSISEQSLEFIIKLFDKTLNINLLFTYVEEIEKYIRERKFIDDKLQYKMKKILGMVFCEANRWSDITLLCSGLRCLEAALMVGEWKIDEKYNITNIGLDTVKEIIRENEIGAICMERLKSDVQTIDVLIIIATKDEEVAILDNDKWEEFDDLEYHYFVHIENGITFALARGIDKGAESAAIVAEYFVMKLKPKVITMVGFAAGRKGSVTLGDVVVAYRVFNYDVGKQISEDVVLHEIDSYKIKSTWKQIAERFGEEWRDSIKVNVPKEFEAQKIEFLHEFIQSNIIEANAIYDMQKYPDWFVLLENLEREKYISIEADKKLKITDKGRKYINRYDVLNPNGYEYTEPQTKVGIIATGTKVQQWSGIFEKIAVQDKSVCALEMEATAIGKVAEFKNIPFLIVKGIGDYAQDGKSFDNRFIEYACHSSYRFVIEFFSSKDMIGEF